MVAPATPLANASAFAQFEALTLDPARFTHRLHLEFAWTYLQRDGFPQGAANFSAQLKKYVARVGASTKYHETLTWAYLVLLNEERELHSGPDEDFETVLARRPELMNHREGPVMQTYGREQLDSDEARRVFMLPRAG